MTRACGCCSLRTGVLVIVGFGIVVGGVLCGSGIHNFATESYFDGAVFLPSGLVLTTTSILLLVGVKKQVPRLLLQWPVVVIILMLARTGTDICKTVLGMFKDNKDKYGFLFADAVSWAAILYSAYVVIAYYKEDFNKYEDRPSQAR